MTARNRKPNGFGKKKQKNSVLRILPLVLALAALLGAGTASAAQLVDNLGQLTASGDASVTSTQSQAQAFTTGNATGGYGLDSVQLQLSAFSGTTADVTVSINSVGMNGPGSAVHTLSNPATISTGTQTFTASSGATLAASTTYFVVISSASASTTLDLHITGSSGEDAGGATGWSIADNSVYGSGTSWTSASTSLHIRVDGTVPPMIAGIELTSDPGEDQTYAYYGSGLVDPDVVEATVSFTQEVTVTGTPQLELDFDGTPKTADCAIHATDSAKLVCRRTVAENDSAPAGIAIAANKLALNGGTINVGTDAVGLAHEALAANAAHKVDGIRPTLVTTGEDAPQTSTDGSQIIFTASEDIGSVIPGSIALKSEGSSISAGITATFSGRTVTVTLLSVFTIEYGQTVVLQLGLGAIHDTAGNISAADATEQAVTNNVPQPPAAITGVEITSDPGMDKIYAPGDDIEVTATFDRAVNVSGTPRIEVRLGGAGNRGDRWAEYSSGTGTTALVFSYTVVATDESSIHGIAVGRFGLAADNLDLNGGTITTVATGENASPAYAPLMSDSGHLVNWARPTLSEAVTSTDGRRVLLRFSEDLDGEIVAINSGVGTLNFTFKVDGTTVAPGGSVATVSGNLVTLRLATALTSSTQTVTVSYTDPTSGDDSTGIEDLAGNDADSFTDQTVTNRFRLVDTPNEIPSNWAVVPSGLSMGDKFRLLFVTSTTRDATSSDIADYNTHVQTAAAAGHDAIQAYSDLFRAVASTASDDARGNTATTYTSPDTGVPIYWLGGNKLADGYPDFYDGTWDDESGVTDESGAAYSNLGNPERVWTGSADNGTEAEIASIASGLGSSLPEIGWLNTIQNGDTSPNPIFGNAEQANSNTYPLYALSPVFVVGPPAVSSGSAVAPSGLSVGDKFRLLFLSSTTRDATSSDIADYNTHVQTAAASGHAAIRAFSSSFLAVASTASDDARDNTSTTYTATDTGLPIYWLGGNKAADDYQDFYDGSWDDEANAKDESGNARSISATDRPWTGSDHDGTVVS